MSLPDCVCRRRDDLESRIAALNAELESARAYAVSCSVNSQNDSARREEAESEVARLREELVKWQLAFGFIDADEALDDCATKLATERAAREQLCDDYVRMSNDCEIAKGECDILRSERDTARQELAETLAALEKANENFVNQHRDCVVPLMNERDTALAQRDEWASKAGHSAAGEELALARVKELEPWEKRYDKLNVYYEAQAEQLEKEHDRRVAAETALASALARVKDLEEILRIEREAHCDTAEQCEEHEEAAANAKRMATVERLVACDLRKDCDALESRAEAAERERNEHAKHRANLDRKNQELSRENERLVDYASSCQRERDTALARVEEQDIQLQHAAANQGKAVAAAQRAESALASARVLPALWRAQANQYPKTVEGDYGAAGVSCCANELEAALASHPSPAPVALHRCPVLNSECLRECESTAECELREAPVAAHCQECVELGACPAEAERLFEESGDDEPEEDAESIIERLDEALCSLLHTGGEIGEHSPRTHLDLFYAKQAESPVAAPCSGCAAIAEAVSDTDTYGEARADDAGRLARRIRKILSDRPDPDQAPSNPRGTGPVPMLLGDDPAEASRRETGDW